MSWFDEPEPTYEGVTRGYFDGDRHQAQLERDGGGILFDGFTERHGRPPRHSHYVQEDLDRELQRKPSSEWDLGLASDLLDERAAAMDGEGDSRLW